jgi:hypothetical protein
MKTITLSALNIVVSPPHSPERYVDLLRATYRQRKTVALRGDYKALLGGMHVDGNVIVGQFYKFFDVDPSRPWFDIDRKQEAFEEDVAKIQIPENLKPHHHAIDFVFFTSVHKLVFVAQDGKAILGPTTCKAMLDRLFESQRIVERFGTINVTIEPHQEQLERIIALKKLRRLTIELTPPNPDDLSEAERAVMRRMHREGASRYTEELVAQDSQGLKPDADRLVLAEIAQSNGRVAGVGEDEIGRSVAYSTTDEPIREVIRFDNKTELKTAVLLEQGRELLQKLRGRRP